MSMLQAAMRALDFGNAAKLVSMGLKSKQTFDVFGAYFRGVEFARAGQLSSISELKNLASRPWVGVARAGLVAGGALAAWQAIPRSDVLAIPAGLGTAAGSFYGLGRVTQNIPAKGAALGLRAAGGLIAGSLAYQGLRSPRPDEYRVM